jgi:hypothetical protein
LILRGTVVGNSEELYEELPAVYLGKWLLVQLKSSKYPALVRNTDVTDVDLDIEVPGFTILDGRSGWKYDKSSRTVKVFAKAKLISSDPDVSNEEKPRLCLVLIKEARARKKSERKPEVYKPASVSRVEIGTMKKVLTIVGDLFVQPTGRAYVPALLVQTRTNELGYILVGAMSAMQPLEDIRRISGSLDGAMIEISKDGPERTARYQIRHVK